MVVLLLLLSGDVETNPGPVGEVLHVFNISCIMVCEKGAHGQRTLQVYQEGVGVLSSVSTFKARQTGFIVSHQLRLPLRSGASTVIIAFQAMTHPLLMAIAP